MLRARGAGLGSRCCSRGEDDGGVLVNCHLGEGLEVVRLKRERMGHHDVRSVAPDDRVPRWRFSWCAVRSASAGR